MQDAVIYNEIHSRLKFGILIKIIFFTVVEGDRPTCFYLFYSVDFVAGAKLDKILVFQKIVLICHFKFEALGVLGCAGGTLMSDMHHVPVKRRAAAINTMTPFFRALFKCYWLALCL